MEDGRRLENMSWRIWNRETLCCESQPQLATTPALDIARPRPGRKDIPELSASVDSAASEESDASEGSPQSQTEPLTMKSFKPRTTDCTISASRGKEKHITSLGLEKMVNSIQEKQNLGPLSPTITDAVPSIFPPTELNPQPSSPAMNAPLRSSNSSSSTAPISSSESDHSARQVVGSDTSTELLISHSVVRGFSPNQVSSSYRSHTNLAPAPTPAKSALHSKGEGIRKSGVFLLGSSSGEEDSSFEDHLLPKIQSTLTAGLKKPTPSKKQLSFRDEVESRTLNNKSPKDEEVFESDDEGEVPDSAIEDSEEDEEEETEDDDEDWEDDASENVDNSTTDQPLFQRVDSHPNLVSRKSLLTLHLGDSQKVSALSNVASRSAPALKRSRTSMPNGLPMEVSTREDATIGHYTPKTKAVGMKTCSNQNLSLSPRTTRRNMLANEMTESLRKDVLWERQQKRVTVNAVLKRRHTAFDVSNLKDYPKEHEKVSNEAAKTRSANHYFGQGLGEYHEAGW